MPPRKTRYDHSPNSILHRMLEIHFREDHPDPIRDDEGGRVWLAVEVPQVVRPDQVDERASLSQQDTLGDLNTRPATWLNVIETTRPYFLGGGNAGGSAWMVTWEIKIVGRYHHVAAIVEQLPPRMTRPYRDKSGWTVMYSHLVSEEGVRRENVRTAAAYGVSFRFESMIRATHKPEEL